MASKFGGVPVNQPQASRFGGVPVQQAQQPVAQPEQPQSFEVRGIPIDGRFRPEAEKIMQELSALGVPQKTIEDAILSKATNTQGGEFISGIPGALPTIASGIVAEPIAGLSGIAAAPFGAGAETVRAVQKGLTKDPIGSLGKDSLQTIGEVLQPVGKAIKGTGEFIQETTGSPLAATAFETGAAAIPELLGLKGVRGLTRAPSTRVDIPEPTQVRSAREASEATGIDLFEAQQTLSAPALERQSFVQQLPVGVQKASQELSKQNAQASRAVDDLLSKIGPDDSIVLGQERFRSAAQRAVEAKKQIRAERSSPIYTEAFIEAKKNNLFVDVSDLSQSTKSLASGFPAGGEVSRSFSKITKWLDDAGRKSRRFDPLKLETAKVVDRQNLSDLHNAKIEIDQMMNKKFDGSLGNTTKRELTSIQKQLVDKMAEASPTYDKARATFEKNSPPVNAIEESIIGKISDLDDTQLKGISTKIFDPQQANVKTVSDARKIISEVDPDAWNMLMRSEVERRMGSIKANDLGSIENVPGKLHNAIFGNTKQKNTLLAGANKETRQSLNNLDVALKRAALGRERGSQTASRGEIRAELRGGVVSGLRELFRQPVDTIVRTGENAQFDRRVSSMADALFDPKYRAETSRLIKAKKGKELTRLILSIEATKSSAREGRETLEQEVQQRDANQ